MKIQEMRSGSVHFEKKMHEGRHVDIFVMSAIDEILPQLDEVWPTATTSELEDHRWSVVSFDKIEAGSLTYNDAVNIMSELNSCGISGLCIITNDAAARLKS